jgi:putative SOS response-associated peptidase YedK
MCGRFSCSFELRELYDEFGMPGVPPEWEARYNVAPSQSVLAATDVTSRTVEWLRWGLIPSWAKDSSIGNKLINARAETITEKPSFRSAYQKRRCLIFADGFYEWRKPVGGKGKTQPFYFKLRDGKPFAFAGLWETWKSAPDVDILKTCTIITTEANSLVTPIHDRMPVIFGNKNAWNWMMGGVDLQKMLVPFDANLMTAYPVGTSVNSPGIDNKICIVPLNDLFAK